MTKLGRVYEIIKISIGRWQEPMSDEKMAKDNEMLQKMGGWFPRSFEESHFISTLGLSFSDVHPYLESLDRLKLIKFLGTKWKKFKNPKTELEERKPVYLVRLLKIVDPNSIIDDSNNASSNGTILSKSKKSKIVLPSFPPNLKWEGITIRFFNKHDVMIKGGGQTIHSNFEAMGFMDDKKKLPDVQWELLEELSKRHGEISWQNNKGLNQKQVDAIKKRKQILSEKLRSFFRINEDPFSDYKKGKAYTIKINLVPVGVEPDDDSKDTLGVREYLTKECPEIDDRKT